MHEFASGSGRRAKLVVPQKVAAGRPWIWRTEFFGHEPQADAALLKAGWHVAYVDMQNLYGGPPAMGAMDAFYEEMTKGRGLASKVVLEGFSRGGLYALNWGILRPKNVSSIYNDAPVCDFLTWPAGQRGGQRSNADWERLLAVYRLTEAEALQGQHSPVHRLEPLAKAKVPLLHVFGDADEAVPYLENTQKVVENYRALGGEINVIAKPGVKHHPHSLPDPQPIVEFIQSHFKATKLTVEPGLAAPADVVAGLPNVLLIGDSISMGYTPEVRKSLAGKANVWRVPVNGGPTTNGMKYLEHWLAERTWQVIHFNWGLHDLKHVDGTSDTLLKVDAPGSHRQVALADYESNLTKLCLRLVATKAQLIWAETTPVPEGATGRLPADVASYNAAAAKVMEAQKIAVNPLHSHALAAPELQKPRDVHYTEAGSAHLAQAVVRAIEGNLAKARP
jgi:pimeloyl-ACP methyl ester carboxylesterase